MPARFIEHSILAGQQPIFCNISLASWGSRGTVVVPVPSDRGPLPAWARIRRTIWLRSTSEPDFLLPESDRDLNDFTRKYAHALLNLTHGVRLWDRPCLGYLAAAHQLAEGHVLYIPDVMRLPEGGTELPSAILRGSDPIRVVSSSTSEQAFLGMASVLYIPIPIAMPAADAASADRDTYAVLMLWSAVPHRWSHCFAHERGLVHARHQLCREIGFLFSWLRDLLLKDRADHLTHEVSVFTLMSRLSDWARNADQQRWDSFRNQFGHGTDELVGYLEGIPNTAKPCYARDWLHSQMTCADALMHQLRIHFHNPFADLRIELDVQREADPARRICMPWHGTLEQFNAGKVASFVPDSLALTLSEHIANQMVAREVDNFRKYAQSLIRLTIDVSHQYFTLRLFETPTEDARRRLLGSDCGYWSYFSLRRGLPIAYTRRGNGVGSGMGIGLSIFSALARRTRMYRTVYCSPDGELVWSELALPHSSQPIGSRPR